MGVSAFGRKQSFDDVIMYRMECDVKVVSLIVWWKENIQPDLLCRQQ
jgi:hypothetical protein